jgi:tricorn protease
MRVRSLLLCGVILAASAAASAQPPLLLQHPSLSATEIAFDYGGEIWTVGRNGGHAMRLVTGEGQLSGPIFSPDGSLIAFTGKYDGNTDVYVVPAAGGEPKRLTWHPGADTAVGWTPDGRSILFRSPRVSPRDLDQLYVVDSIGGPPREVPLPSGEDGSFSADGARIAYNPHPQWQPAWKNYRGGQTANIWIADLATSHVTPIPRPNSNDRDPMWVGNRVYFLSDRGGPITLYSYDVGSGAIQRLVDNSRGFDMKSASAGPGGIVIDHFGKLELFDTASNRLSEVPVTIDADLPQLRPHFEALKADTIEHAAITPSGKRVLFETHGEVLSAPAEKGEIRNLTQSPGSADRDPAPSPDGRSVAMFSDSSGEYALVIRPASGVGAARTIPLGDPPSFFYEPRWSPDSRKIVFHDKRLNLWMVDLDRGAKPIRIDTDRYDSPDFKLDPAWSADSRWIVYTKQLPNHLHAAWVYSLATGRSAQLTDGTSDVASPRFDRSGKYLYFTASTDRGLGAGWLDMSSMGRSQSGAAYVLVLRKDVASPVLPESDEEPSADQPVPAPLAADRHGKAKSGTAKADDGAADHSDEAKGPPPPVTIDFDGIQQRIVALPIPRANFAGLETGKEGVVYTLVAPTGLADEDYLDAPDNGPPETLYRFAFKDRKNAKIAEDVRPGSFSLSADGDKMLLARKDDWIVADADAPLKPDASPLKLDSMSVWVDPKAEWAQMYNEVWRIERDFFYDPKFHGLDMPRAERLYARYLPGIAARQDLNALFEEMTGHLQVGHTFIRGGDLPEQPKEQVGLLGADFEVANGRWRIAKVLQGENWNPKLVSPLSQPGIDVHTGEYLFAVNGKPVSADAPVYESLDGTAGKHTVLTLSPSPDGRSARNVTVVPIGNETELRLRDWMESNRKLVDRLSGGRVAYVYLPDTAAGGFANFNRYYYSQVGKQAAVIDERFNHGGDIADYIVQELTRTPQMVNETRQGEPVTEPAQAIFGPKVMVINEMSGSGGDALPWLFKKNHVGPLVGERTWGGLVGIGGYPPLMDGGSVTAPRWAIYGTHGQWEVEDTGIAPDVEVAQDPELIRQGHDPQLERAVAEALALLQQNPPQQFVAPQAPDKHQVLPDE